LPKKEEKKENPLLAAMYQVTNVLSFSLVQLFAKLLFQKYPEMTPISYLLIRSAIHTLAILIFLNIRAKEVLWTKVPRDKYWLIAFRAIIGVACYYIIFYAIKMLPLF
jgi:drug/metabolite transporter (DMT)-like permease